jgi:hypothetical protein
MPAAAAKAGDRRLETPPGRCGAAQYIGTKSRSAAAQHAGYNRPLWFGGAQLLV